MGLCTNRVLMGQPLLALFSSAKSHGSGPAPPLGSASNDKRKERAARLLTAIGTSRRLKVGQSMSALPRELSLKVGDGGNREGGISWGCLTPPLLHQRSDMPCPTITSSN